ncbi:tRNA methyltransferase 10 homolog C [Bombina bombina]|uniref:tRNA methyltransferase 10 homolog C n=1 Tax=Bombina bombina TaxID=8345 RepID=UPI00235A8028|nr:tRNA methyltransferase 10 homolog C [Bombina bombina]XP_053563537.1 tRNA methyltransferase 10 homolog C [Bombina bombina]
MAFFNTILRTLRFPAFHTLAQERCTRLFLKNLKTFSQCRTLNLSHHLRKEEGLNIDPKEKLDLEEWKTVMRSSPQDNKNEQELESQEDSSLSGMRELVEMWRLAGRAVPEVITAEQLKVLNELSTKSSRKKYLKFLSLKEILKKKKKEKKSENRKSTVNDFYDSEEKEEKNEIKNTLFLQFWERSMDNLQRWRAAQAMLFGQPLIFDMAYENYMSRIELQNTVNQLMESEGWNRRAADPFHIYFCNLQADGPYHKELVKRYNGAFENILITATDKSHVDLFPRDHLIYLTADSPNELKTFDHNKVYIVGSLVDKCQQTGVSLANAKRLKLATARLPLDRYLKWDVGAKNLTLDQMIRILTCIKDTGDWEKALSYVPTRKHSGFVGPSHSQKKRTSKHSKMYEFGKTLNHSEKVQHPPPPDNTE